MKNYIALLVVMTVMIPKVIYAQNYYVTDIIEVQNDLSARTNPRKDSLGNECALLKINVPSVKRITFEGSVGDVKYLPGEFNVYIAEGTKSIKYLTQDSAEKAVIDFSQYGIDIIGKTVYKVILQAKDIAVATTGSVSITANQPGSIVLIDGIPSGQIPVTVNGLSAGAHTISVPNTIGYSCADTKVLIKTGEITNVFLTLTEKAYQDIGIEWATPGGDSSGWYQVRTKKIKDNGKEGITDFTGRILVPCEYDYIYPDLQSGFYIVTLNDKQGLYKPGEGLVVDCIYDSIVTREIFSEWHRAQKGNSYGYIDRKGVEIVPFIFTDGTWMSTEANSSMIIASIYGGTYGEITGVFDAFGNVIVEPRLATQCEYHEGMSVGYYKEGNDTRYFIMDIYGNEILLPKGFFVDGFMVAKFQNGLLPVQNSEKKWGYINRSGETVIPYQYEFAGSFENGYAYVTLNGDDIYIDKNGRKIADKSEVDKPFATQNGKHGYLRVTDGKKFGLMDENGALRIPIKYESIYVGSYITAILEGERLVFNTDADYLFTIPDNLEIEESDSGIIMIRDKESGTYGFFNENGDVLGNCIYTARLELGNISEGMAMLGIGDRFGFMDNTGNVVVPAIYSAALPYQNGVTFVRKADGKWIKIDKYNNQIQ